MTHIITSLCLRDAGCVEVCPVECIVPGKPVEEWPWYYIDPDSCIDCGACVSECPFEAIFPKDEVPSEYKARGSEKVAMPAGTPSYEEDYNGVNHYGAAVHLKKQTRTLKDGEIVDLTKDTQPNYEYFNTGPGYKSAD